MLEKEKINFEKTIIVGIVTQNQSEEKLIEYLDELEFLTFTAGGEVVKRFWQKMEKPNPKTFLGTGKIDEISRITQDFGIAYAKIARKLKDGSVVHEIEHTGAILLFNPKGQLMAFFTTPHNATGLADDYQLLIG